MGNVATDQFAHHLQHALSALYDPLVLSSSPLVLLFGIEEQRDPAAALRQVLIDAIEALRPNELIPYRSRGWRIYQLLRRRYIEQLTQHEVARDLSLSIRQLQREEKIARELLADRLWDEHNVGTKADLLNTASSDAGAPGSGPGNAAISGGLAVLSGFAILGSYGQPEDTWSLAPSTTQELEALSRTTPFQVVQLNETVREVLDTLHPLLQTTRTITDYEPDAEVPPVTAKLPLLRQALLNIASVAIRRVTDGRLLVHTFQDSSHTGITIQVIGRPDAVQEEAGDMSETLEMARQLLGFSLGSLRLIQARAQQPTPALPAGAPLFDATVELRATEVFPILVIDDNADARQLLERYLLGTLYQFIGAEDAQQALALLQQTLPQAIVLDVMLPRQDGWMLLGQIREHPRLNGIPILVSTILPQKDLALALGAAEFLRKPIRRPDLLAALARHVGPRIGSATGSE